MLKKISKYAKQHRVEVFLLIFILLLAAFFRLYKISDYMTFLGDEGRDMLVAKSILRGDLTLLGPRASAGDFYLGPAYYYMIAPFLFLANYDPVGPSIMVALFGIATVFLVYYVGKKFFGMSAGLVASSLYAIAPVVVAYSRSSWNPNIMPFFTILTLYLLYLGVKTRKLKLFLLIGFLLGIMIQLHYLTVFLSVIILLYIVFGNYLVDNKIVLKRYLIQIASITAGSFLAIVPFLAFEVRHGFPNTRAVFLFIFSGNSQDGYAAGQSFIGNIFYVFIRLYTRLIAKYPPPDQIMGDTPELFMWRFAAIVLALFSVISIFFVKDKLIKLLLVLWFFVGIFLFAFYKKPIYDYYLGFLFPLPFLLIGNFLTHFSKLKKFKKPSIIIAGIVFASLFIFNLTGAPFLFPANKQKDQAKKIADFVLLQAADKPYNFALLTKGNSDHVYRYFLEAANKPPVTIENVELDPERKSVTDQLIIVCEYQDCKPLGESLWEVAGFGRAEIEGKWDVSVVEVLKLRHYKDPNSPEN